MSLQPLERFGSRTPQIRHASPYNTSAGPEAIELAASAGLILDPWQQDVLTDALADGPGGKWRHFESCLVVSRQNGKGSVLEALVLAHLLLFGSELIMWTAHETKTAFEGFRRVESLVDGSRELRKLVKPHGVTRGNGKEGIEFRSGARLRFVARSSGSGRGFSGDVVILDEAYALTSGHMSALMPTLSARPNPQIWYTSSPPLTPDTGEPMFRLRERAQAGARGLCYYDWGIQGFDLADLSGLDLDDRTNWYMTNPATGYRLSEEFTANERSSMDDESFARERLGVWPPRQSGHAVIDEKLWASLADRSLTAGPDIAFAVDVTPDRRYSTIVAYSPSEEDGTPLLEVIEHRRGTDWVVEALAELKKTWDPVAIGLDPRSPAGSLLLDMQAAGIKPPDDPEVPRYGDLALTSTQDVGAACGQLVDAVNQKALRHRDQPPLNSAVANGKTRPLGDSWAWGRRVSEVDISALVAATLARWAFESRIEKVARGYDVLASVY